MSSTSFRKAVWDYYKKHGRHDLPWRKTRDPYKIMVSEVMLQQTQVDRVIPYYESFIKKYPTPAKLAAAPLAAVLVAWQGLGYNRRAKMLWQAAPAVGYGKFPKHEDDLRKLPGVGPYTARAIMAFAYNADTVFIETNIRTAVIHHFFPRKQKVTDTEIEKVLGAVLPKGKAREWYSALMDYGAALKRTGVKTNPRVKGYAKQSTFEGSLRQARGAVLRALVPGPLPGAQLTMLLGKKREVQMKSALAGLTKESLIVLSRGKFKLPS